MAVTPDYQGDALARITAVLRTVAPDLDMTVGSVLQQQAVGIASSHADVKGSQDYLIQQSSLLTATGTPLVNLALDKNTAKIFAGPAVQSVLFTAASGAPGGSITIPQGFVVGTQGSQSAAALLFDLISPLTVPSPGSAVGQCQAEISGSSGNVVAGAITQFSDYPYLLSVVNQSVVTQGNDDETDSSLRGRALGSNVVQGSNAAVTKAAYDAGAIVATLNDPKDGSAHTTMYAGLADGTLPSTLQTSVQSAVNSALPIGETNTVSPFSIVTAPLTANLAVPTGFDTGLTTSAVQSSSISFANGLLAGQTMQPLPWVQYVAGQVAALQAKGADFYPTSAVPTVSSSQLFRFVAAPPVPTLAQTTGGTIPTTSTVYVVLAYTTPGGDTLASVETSVALTGSNDAVTVTVPAPVSPAVTSCKVFASTSSGTEKYQTAVSVSLGVGGSTTLNSISTGGAAPITTGTITVPTITVTSI